MVRISIDLGWYCMDSLRFWTFWAINFWLLVSKLQALIRHHRRGPRGTEKLTVANSGIGPLTCAFAAI